MNRTIDGADVGRSRDLDASEAAWRQPGFRRVRGLFTTPECKTLAAHCARIDDAGARDPLERNRCRALPAELRFRLAASPLLPAHHVAVQCGFFQKSTTRNRLVALHRDLAVPVAGRADESTNARTSLVPASCTLPIAGRSRLILNSAPTTSASAGALVSAA